jgi:hypothetical protein
LYSRIRYGLEDGQGKSDELDVLDVDVDVDEPLKEVSNAIDDLVAVVSSFIETASLIFLCIAVPAFLSLLQMPCIQLEEKFTPKPSEKLNVVGWYSASN